MRLLARVEALNRPLLLALYLRRVRVASGHACIPRKNDWGNGAGWGSRCPRRSAGGDLAADERRTSRKHRQVNLWGNRCERNYRRLHGRR